MKEHRANKSEQGNRVKGMIINMQSGEIGVEILILGMVQTNCYVIHNLKTKEAIIIDPADKEEKIKSVIEEKALNVVGVFLTHGHFDHILAATSLTSYYHTNLYAGVEEKALLEDANMNCSVSIRRPCSVKADHYLQDGDVISLAGIQIKTIHTPGHTVGGVCYYLEEQNLLFSGDTLFLESVGRSDLPTGNGEKLIKSIRQKILVLKDETKVFPGHGGSTTIGYERINNPYLNGRE